ncbi:tautomerase family protein [Salinarimonas sp. NSM]|uniref:tautomerase family protein n=1 Tax=Salinarimonas sp. NSM TaxID=3458003 RepID=UPI004036A78C
MPIVTVQLLEGYDESAKGRLGRVLTDAVRSVIDAPPEVVTIIVQDLARDGYMRGRTRRRPGPVLPDAAETVRSFLSEMEARDLDAARARLAEGFEMTFPGNVRMRTLDELVAWARPRYRFVRKTYERFDTAPAESETLVYCFGTLSGEWPDGTAFSGIRFIDRFALAGGKIVRQDVWNDIAEVKAGAAS